MTEGQKRCGLSSLFPMSCRGRAEEFARRLHNRLRSLGSQDGDDTTESSWLAANQLPNAITSLQPRNLSENDHFIDFEVFESPGSPEEAADESELGNFITNRIVDECDCPKFEEIFQTPVGSIEVNECKDSDDIVKCGCSVGCPNKEEIRNLDVLEEKVEKNKSKCLTHKVDDEKWKRFSQDSDSSDGQYFDPESSDVDQSCLLTNNTNIDGVFSFCDAEGLKDNCTRQDCLQPNITFCDSEVPYSRLENESCHQEIENCLSSNAESSSTSCDSDVLKRLGDQCHHPENKNYLQSRDPSSSECTLSTSSRTISEENLFPNLTNEETLTEPTTEEDLKECMETMNLPQTSGWKLTYEPDKLNHNNNNIYGSIDLESFKSNCTSSDEKIHPNTNCESNEKLVKSVINTKTNSGSCGKTPEGESYCSQLSIQQNLTVECPHVATSIYEIVTISLQDANEYENKVTREIAETEDEKKLEAPLKKKQVEEIATVNIQDTEEDKRHNDKRAVHETIEALEPLERKNSSLSPQSVHEVATIRYHTNENKNHKDKNEVCKTKEVTEALEKTDRSNVLTSLSLPEVATIRIQDADETENIDKSETKKVKGPLERAESSYLLSVHSLHADDDIEDLELERIPRVRRCSSLKTGKTPPGTPGRKKIVRFADVLGLDLADVRTFLDEIPKIPTSAYDDLSDADLSLSMSDTSLNSSITSSSSSHLESYAKTTKTLVPLFQQPGGEPDFLERVKAQQVCLENAILQDPVDLCVCGTVRVRNLDFHKSVQIRYTTDAWKNYADLQATYVTNSCDGFSDKFSFTLYVHTLAIGQNLEFAIRFQCKGCQYWDSNRGGNYCFQCLPKRTTSYLPLTVPEPDECTSAFYYDNSVSLQTTVQEIVTQSLMVEHSKNTSQMSGQKLTGIIILLFACLYFYIQRAISLTSS